MNDYRLPTSRALFNMVTVHCEWNLKPQPQEADMLTTTLKTPSSLDVWLLNVNVVGLSNPIE